MIRPLRGWSNREAAVGQSLQLLSSLLENSNATDGVLAEVSVATDAGVLKVVALSATSVAPESNVSVGGEDGTSVTVPGTVLQQAAAAAGSGLVLLSVTLLSENVTDKIGSDDARLGRRLATAASTLRGQSVSLNFRDAEGNRIEVKNLQTPIELVLAVDNENATCAYYDEARFSWSEEGLETVMDGIPGQITCRTTHLSIFGGVLQFVLSNVIATLKCSTAAQLLSAEALAMLGTSAWLSYGPSVVIFVSLAVFAMVFGCALRMDRRANQAIPWEKKEPVLLRKRTTVAQLIEELPPEEPKTCWERITSFIGAAVDWTLWFIGLLFGYENLAEVVKEFLPNAPVSTVNRCITTIHAHKTGTSRDSIDGVKKLSKTFSRSMSMTSAMSSNEDKSPDMQRRRPGLLRKLSSSVITTVDSGLKSAHSNGLLPYEEMKKHGAQAVESFLSSTWVKRILLLFPALHPWLETVRFSLFTSHAVRAALIITKLTSAAAVGALFFSSSSTTPDSDPDCQPPTDLLASMVQTATVGIISALLGDLVIFALFILQSRSAVDRNEWNSSEKTKILMKWRCKSFVFWSAWSCHAGFSIIYVLLFLANVSLQDAIKWLESCCVSLLQDLILVPLAMAFILATLASFAICCSRKVQHKIENDWLADEESEQDDNEDELEDEDAKGRWIEPGDVQEVEMACENLVSVTLADDQEELHSIELVNSRTGLRDSAHGEAAEEQRRSTSAVLIDPEALRLVREFPEVQMSRCRAGNGIVISFDLDDTLWPLVDVVNQANGEVARDNKLLAADDVMAAMRQIRSTPAGANASYTCLRRQAYEELLGGDRRSAERILKQWIRARGDAAASCLYPDVLESLEGLLASGAIIGAITNGASNPQQIAKLAPFFSFCASGEEDAIFPHRKPSPVIFEAAVARARDLGWSGSLQSWWHVGDDPATDVSAAARVGLRTVLVSRPGKAENRFSVTSAAELAARAAGADRKADLTVSSLQGLAEKTRIFSEMVGCHCGGRDRPTEEERGLLSSMAWSASNPSASVAASPTRIKDGYPRSALRIPSLGFGFGLGLADDNEAEGLRGQAHRNRK
ncbi:hypothetical protein AK812_SmicGene18223 [Symbiodinium microadriaticum]|uniref:GAIN-B domain-containing protein n=1 Tax=Symbiodinium microadriaticum TaxID=2951 RepID=A0A1Q9DVR3_SYMMI|nr:hypothetical protein AK812_SmicGene18223 [Symbiodinium microadriaticum]